MFTVVLRVGCRTTAAIRSRIKLIHGRNTSHNGPSTTNSQLINNINRQSKYLWSDAYDKTVKQINNFIQSKSSSIGIDGILFLTSIQQNMLYEYMQIELKHTLVKHLVSKILAKILGTDK
ncbi:unnamed protein product [Rotaria socialis]